MKHGYLTPLLFCFLIAQAHAQSYCSPSFLNGCSLWRNLSVSIGTINWTIGATNCATSDYTSLSTTITAGVAAPMSVSSGNWTGCAVWIDLNNNSAFEDSENLYYSYVGGDPSYTYNFSITVPGPTPNGAYRMRVVAPWGSDGFLNTNINGYGPCGNYQYGNFDDFTVIVSGSTGLQVDAMGSLVQPIASPNPTSGLLALTNDSGERIDRIVVLAPDGRMVKDLPINTSTGSITVDLGEVPSGIYLLACHAGASVRMVRVMKD